MDIEIGTIFWVKDQIFFTFFSLKGSRKVLTRNSHKNGDQMLVKDQIFFKMLENVDINQILGKDQIFFHTFSPKKKKKKAVGNFHNRDTSKGCFCVFEFQEMHELIQETWISKGIS